jgi:phosphoribosylamine--glycine ligase
LGFPRGHVWSFPTAEAASAFVDGRPGRYVLKRSGAGHASSDTYAGELPDGRDVLAMLAAADPGGGPLVLMDFIDGVEMGVGAYFNGSEFIRPACLDWEHKRFFAGDMGEMTGEMGTVASFAGSDAFFDLTLAKMAPRLRAHGHVGYVNLNTIVNDAGVWPLEFTCRFGYPGFAILSPLQITPWGDLLKAMVAGAPAGMETAAGFAVGIVISTPPFPYSREEVAEAVGLPVIVDDQLDRNHLHYGEVGLDAAGRLVTSGLYGWTLVVTGQGATIADAQARAYCNARGVFTPRARYRLDIGDRLIARDHAELQRLGHAPAGPATASIGALK